MGPVLQQSVIHNEWLAVAIDPNDFIGKRFIGSAVKARREVEEPPRRQGFAR